MGTTQPCLSLFCCSCSSQAAWLVCLPPLHLVTLLQDFFFHCLKGDSCDKMAVMYDVSVLWEPLDNSAWSSTLWTQTLMDQERKSSRNWIVLIFSQSITITLLSFVLMLNKARPYTKISSGTEISNKPEYSFSNSKTVHYWIVQQMPRYHSICSGLNLKKKSSFSPKPLARSSHVTSMGGVPFQ